MSLHGGGGSSGGKEKKPKSGGFRTTGRGGASTGGGPGFTPPSRPAGGGATYTPGSGGSSSGSGGPEKPPGGGFKMPGLGGGGGGGGGGLNTIWGGEPTQPGLTSTWSEGTKMGVAVLAGLLILGALAALVFGLAKGSKPKVNNSGGSNTSVLTPFNPPTQAGATETDLPIVFTDGTTADLLYDPSLGLNQLPGGVSLSDSGQLGSVARGADQFQIDHGGASFVANELPTSVVRNVPGPNNSPVPILPAADNSSGKNVNGNWMDFHYGDWRVGVWEGTGNEMMSLSDEQSWAADMNGTVTSSGWLTLTGSNGLTLTQFGQPNGPQIQFGNISPTGIILTPEACTVPLGAGVQQNSSGVPYRLTPLNGGYEEGFLCQPKANMTFDIYGNSNFVTTAANSLAVTNLKLAPARPNPSSSPAG